MKKISIIAVTIILIATAIFLLNDKTIKTNNTVNKKTLEKIEKPNPTKNIQEKITLDKTLEIDSSLKKPQKIKDEAL